jgi:hypothetical protein
MSVQSPVAIRALALALLLGASGCAYSREKGADRATVFRNSEGKALIIYGQRLEVSGATYPLNSCSDATNNCVSSPIGLLASFPRECPNGSWLPSTGPMRHSSGFPHSFGGRYANSDGSSFLYDWDPQYGIISIVFDPARKFISSQPSYIYNGPTVYYYKSGARLFPCK